MKTIELAKYGPVIPVIVINHIDEAIPLAEALLEGGIRVLEVTLRTECGLKAIEAIAKNEDYSTMFRLIGKKIQSIFLIGESKELFSQNIKGCSVNLVESMEEAVISSKKLAKEGAVLLSPGCARFDMFSDFSERGVVFKNLVLK